MVPVTNAARLDDPANYPGLPEALGEAGRQLEQRFPGGTWWTDDASAAQAFIDGYDPLPWAKAQKIAEIKEVGLGKIQTIWPAIADFDTLNLVSDIWASIAAAARSPNANMTDAIAVYSAGKTAIGQVNAAATVAEINAATAAWPF